MATIEHKSTTDAGAHQARRRLIDQGREVSRVAYDPSRGVYVFDEVRSDRDADGDPKVASERSAPKYTRASPPIVVFKVEPYTLVAVPGRYFRQRNGGFVASVRKADYKTTVEGVAIHQVTKDEAKRSARRVLAREAGWSGPVKFEFVDVAPVGAK